MEKKVEKAIVKLCNALKRSRIDYIIIGGVPAILYGVERVTYDIDIIVPDDKEVLIKVINTLKKVGYESAHHCSTKTFIADINNLKPQHILERGCINFRDKAGKLFPVDILPAEYGIVLHLKDSEIEFPIGKSTAFIASPEQLIRWKETTCRPKDLQDIRELKRILKKLPRKYYE